MRWHDQPWFRHLVILVFIAASVVIEMCLYRKLFKSSADHDVIDHVHEVGDGPLQQFKGDHTVIGDEGYTSGLYYSDWSPYPPRKHFPHDIDLSKVSHIYYAFFLIDGHTGELKSSDEWSDLQMDLYKSLAVKLNQLQLNNNVAGSSIGILPKGCIGELFYLRHTGILDRNRARHFKVIMAVGGWSNRDQWPKMVRDPRKVDKFINSCVETMFKYGFDGIDLDWEFPQDDGFEPRMYLELARRLKLKFDELEEAIFAGETNHPKFQLSMATPAFKGKLSVLPIRELDRYIDVWNMMTYDYHGEWSSVTGYHSNLYDGAVKFQPQYKHDNSSDDEGLDANTAIYDMINEFGVDSRKITLGMAAYGRGFTHVKASGGDGRFIDKKFHGVGGASEGEPGMWLYNQLPIEGSKEEYDPDYVSGFCFDHKTKTFVGYDSVESVKTKADYVKQMGLRGGFWWESCGDNHKNPERSLLNAFTERIKTIAKDENSMYHRPETLRYYLEKFGQDEFLSSFIVKVISKPR
ncbi:hypothetical protein ZYGR_0AS04370 [Zygosaccharomyces rouxii]|uniref:chitinase n=1 Tax=Zygosaccharomyces rouxii TaxID=4956 RepID=A0A1Q3AH92_ZYGRO|nr:hypothetical protein ZYGR_0AS04370 [Zygosaccharomyces rouxii]